MAKIFPILAIVAILLGAAPQATPTHASTPAAPPAPDAQTYPPACASGRLNVVLCPQPGPRQVALTPPPNTAEGWIDWAQALLATRPICDLGTSSAEGRRPNDYCQYYYEGSLNLAFPGERALGRGLLNVYTGEWRRHCYIESVDPGELWLIDYGTAEYNQTEWVLYTQEMPEADRMAPCNRRETLVNFAPYSKELGGPDRRPGTY